jgi:hypothetical protein
LQAYLKEKAISVDVFDARGNYDLEKVCENPFAQMYSPRFVPNHHEIPIILTMINDILKGNDLDLDSGLYPDLLLDRAVRFYELPSLSRTRYLAKYRHSKQVARKLVGRYDVIGFTMNYLNTTETCLTSALLKQLDPSTCIVWGGPSVTQATELMKLFLQQGICDGVILGEGEGPLANVAYGMPISEVSGIMTYIDGSTHFKSRQPLDIDSLPTPDWSNIPLDFYYKSASIYSSRGCTNRCNFCGEWALFGPRFRQRSVDKVVKDIEDIKEIFHPQYFIFGDSALNHDVTYFSKLCDLLIEHGVQTPIAAHFRANFSPELASKARQAGFDDAWVGVEAFTNESLALMNKGIEASQNLESIRNVARAGIHVLAMLVVGFGTPTQEMINYKATLDVIHQFSNETVLDTSGLKMKLPIAFRPAPSFLIPGSLDYKRHSNEISMPWHPMLISPQNTQDMEILCQKIAHIPYEFSRQIPDEIVFSIVHGIQDANLEANFQLGGISKHMLNLLQGIMPENLESMLRGMGVPGLEALASLQNMVG